MTVPCICLERPCRSEQQEGGEGSAPPGVNCTVLSVSVSVVMLHTPSVSVVVVAERSQLRRPLRSTVILYPGTLHALVRDQSVVLHCVRVEFTRVVSGVALELAFGCSIMHAVRRRSLPYPHSEHPFQDTHTQFTSRRHTQGIHAPQSCPLLSPLLHHLRVSCLACCLHMPSLCDAARSVPCPPAQPASEHNPAHN